MAGEENPSVGVIKKTNMMDVARMRSLDRLFEMGGEEFFMSLNLMVPFLLLICVRSKFKPLFYINNGGAQQQTNVPIETLTKRCQETVRNLRIFKT